MIEFCIQKFKSEVKEPGSCITLHMMNQKQWWELVKKIGKHKMEWLLQKGVERGH